jgi:hypothetical protein
MRVDPEIPQPLQRSAPRQVRPTAAGAALLVAAFALVVAAFAAGSYFYSLARDDERWTSRVVAAEGEILELRRTRGENSRVAAVFRYTASGADRTATTRLRRSDRDKYSVGSRVPIRYAAERPEWAWIESYGPNITPLWLAMAIPAALAPLPPILWLVYRRQARLLAEGRPAVATVTKARRFVGGHAGAWFVTYEWTLLNGARRSGRYQVEKNPPTVGSTLVIVYDRDNPKRSVRYPAPLARLA